MISRTVLPLDSTAPKSASRGRVRGLQANKNSEAVSVG